MVENAQVAPSAERRAPSPETYWNIRPYRSYVKSKPAFDAVSFFAAR